MAFMTKDSFRLYYEDSGGNAPAIVFLHGAGGNHLSWWQQLPVFVDEYRCIAVDQRGFGQSPDVPGGPGPAALGADVLALLRFPTVLARTMAQKRSGALTAAPTAAQPPIDCATSAARAMPRWSSNARTSAPSAAGPGPPGTSGDWPKPR